MPQRLAPECGRRTRRGEASDGHCTHRTRTHTHTECDDYRSADREAHPTIVGSRHCRLSVLRGALFLESHLILPRTLPSPHLPRRCSRSNVRRVDVALPVCFSLFGFLPVWWSPFLLRFFGSGLGGEVAGSRRGPHCGLDSEQKKKEAASGWTPGLVVAAVSGWAKGGARCVSPAGQAADSQLNRQKNTITPPCTPKASPLQTRTPSEPDQCPLLSLSALIPIDSCCRSRTIPPPPPSSSAIV